MPLYAVKIGEVYLQSDRPITEAERVSVAKALSAHGKPECTILSVDAGEVVVRVHQYGDTRKR
jgi:hypothetical protein